MGRMLTDVHLQLAAVNILYLNVPKIFLKL
jgi:hypothetical protein